MNKIVKSLLFTFLLSNLCISVEAQKIKKNPFQMVKVPDSINLKLALITYKGYNNINSKTGQYIWNLQNRKDFVFKNGIYSFKGFGAHFPRGIFIFNNGKLYTFKSIGAFDPVGVIEEYLDCIKEVKLSDIDIIKYLKAISKYLEEEEGLSYGAEIKKVE